MTVVELPYDGRVEMYTPKEGARLIIDRARSAEILVKGKKERRREYYDIIMTFDIETTKLENLAFDIRLHPESYHYFNICFCWQVIVDGVFIFGRSPEEFFKMLDEVAANIDGLILCYIHNIAFEFNNLRDFFLKGISDEENDIFMKSRSTPLYVRYKNKFEFRCSKLLTGKGLAGVGSDIGYKKLTGDFDYSVLRDTETPLSPLELNYCFRDVMILYKYLERERENFCTSYHKKIVHIAQLPYTVTGYVRIDVKKYFSNTSHGRYILKQTALSAEEYDFISRAMWGGYTHANFRYIGEQLENIFHVDIVSAYPGAFLTPDGFPYKLSHSTIPSKQNFFINLEDPARAVIACVTFKNLKLKPGGVPYVPALKSECDPRAIIENGKVLFAKECKLTACDVDLKLIIGAYSFDDIVVHNYYFGFKKKLPYNIIKLIEKYFSAKTRLKGVAGCEIEYRYAKSKINSIFGMICQALRHGVFKYVDGMFEEIGSEYKEADTMPYQWAIYITAYTRRLIYSMICNMQKNNTFVYSDTDSIFFKYDRDALDAIAEHNRTQQNYLRELQKLYFNIVPENPKGEKQFLFTLDFEDCTAEKTDIKEFCAIGAKRYYIGRGGGVYDVTFSGLRATKNEKGVNGYNTQRLIKMFGSLHAAFVKIKDSFVDLPYVEGVDKLSNYNITGDFYGELNGRRYYRPCTYTLYPQSIRLSLNHDLRVFLQSEVKGEF